MTELREVAVLDLPASPPFAFDATFHKPDHFPSPDCEWEPGARWQTVRLAGESLGVRIEDAGSSVRLRVWAERKPVRSVRARLGRLHPRPSSTRSTS